MGKPKAPPLPDPRDTASASTGTNIGTAIANTNLGNVDQVGPTGNLTYDQTGTYVYNDPFTGDSYDIPQYTATTSLTPEQQAIFDANQEAQLGLGQTAASQAEFLRDYLGNIEPFDTSSIESHLGELADQRLAPRFERDRASLEQRLANQGLAPGSAAWNEEMRSFNEGKNDAYNNLALQGRGQAFQELQAARNQPINEITALLSGSQVSAPSFTMNQPSNIPTTDVAGLINENYNQRFSNYQSQSNSRNQLLGGLFGLAAGGLSGGFV